MDRCFQIRMTSAAATTTKMAIAIRMDSVPNRGAIHLVMKPPAMPPAIPPLPNIPNNLFASRVVQTKLARVHTCITATTP